MSNAEAPASTAEDGGSRGSGPVLLEGLAATSCLMHFVVEPLAAVRRVYERFGPFAVLHSPLKFVKFQRQVVALAIGARFNREVLGDPATWRTVTIGPGGPRNSASRRLSKGIFTLRGPEHESLRRQLLPPLRRRSVDAMGDRLGGSPRRRHRPGDRTSRSTSGSTRGACCSAWRSTLSSATTAPMGCPPRP